MAKYIDADDLKNKLIQAGAICEFGQYLIDNHPAADVRPERHGEWLDSESPLTSSCKCSLCSCYFESETPYCPNCGAKMDGGKNNETD